VGAGRILMQGIPVNWAAPLNQGLLAQWIALPQRLVGLTWRDGTAKNHDGTLTNMATGSATSGWGTTVRPGGYGELRFDGGDDTVTVPSRADLGFSGGPVLDKPFTVMGWFWFNDVTQDCGLITKGAGSGAGEWALWLSGLQNNLKIEIDNTTSGVWRTGEAPITAGPYQSQWVHIAATYDGLGNTWTAPQNGLVLYRNGVAVTNVGSSGGTYSGMAPSTNNVVFGFGAGRANHFSGKMDDVRIYARMLLPREVLATYLASLVGYANELRWQTWPIAAAPAVAHVTGVSVPRAAVF
jgi:hypothetical protein